MDERLRARILARVDVRPDGCWVWTGSTASHGRPLIWAGRTRDVHVVAFEEWRGPRTPGLELDHICTRDGERSRGWWCVNPFHLEEVTHGENMRRAKRK